MLVLDYTTYADIRAVLGVTPEDLEDATLGLSLYGLGLAADLREIALGLAGDFATIAALPEDTWTDTQRVFYETASLFAVYSVARQCLSGLPLFAPKEATDGKSNTVRFAQSPYKETQGKVEQGFGRYRSALVTAYAALQSSTASPFSMTLLATSALSTDPVTG